MSDEIDRLKARIAELEAKAKERRQGADAEARAGDEARARFKELEEAAVWLLRHVTGRCLRANGYILDDTSDLSEFLRAHALKGEQNKQKT